SALDRVLEQIGGEETIFAVRCPAAQEDPAALPPCLRRVSLDARLRHFEEQTLPAARQDADDAARRRDELRAGEPAWNRLEELIAADQRLTARVAELETRRAN